MNRRAVGSVDCSCKECVHAALPQRRNGEGKFKTSLVAAQFPVIELACIPAWAEQTFLSCLLRVVDLHWTKSCHNSGDRLVMGCRGNSDLGWHLGGMGGSSHCWSVLRSMLGAAWNSDGGQSTTAHAPIHAKESCRSRLPCSTVPRQGRGV